MTDQDIFKQLDVFIEENFDGIESDDINHLMALFLQTKTPDEAAVLKQKFLKFNQHQSHSNKIIDQMLSSLVNDPEGLEPGQLLNNYRITERLADGGMGEVYLAERADDQFDKQVALKILSKGLVTDQTIQRFFRERQILAKLTHPNIAPLHDAGMTENNRPWFALEFIQGTTIDKYCEGHQLTTEALLLIFIDVCDAISYAHSKGIVHRDLKPANIMIDTKEHIGNPMILDFGIASLQDGQSMTNMTQTGQIIGTPGYMSPEQITGKHVTEGLDEQSIPLDGRSDIFSLGVILYKVLSNKHPFEASSVTEINYKVLKEPPPPLSTTHINPNLSAVIYQCLEKNPVDRYQSVKALVSDLKSYLSGDAVSARRVNFLQKVKIKLRKHPLVSFLTALLILLILVSSWMLISERLQSREYTKVVQQYAFVSKEIEQQIRQEHMLPHHDLAPQYDQINNDLIDMRLTIKDDGLSGPVYATLGQAHLLLGQAEESVAAFRQSVTKGFTNPKTEIQHGLALALYWEQKRGTSHQINNDDERQQFMEQMTQNYLLPATNKLQSNLNHSQQAPYLQAYLAYLNDDYDQTSQLSIQAFNQDSALYEALRLAGKALMNKGKVLAIDGKFKAALEEFNQAESYLEQAIEIGRSDLLSHYHYCELLKTKLHVAINNIDENFENKIIKAQKSCLRANQLLPDQLLVITSLAEVYNHWSGWLLDLNRNHIPKTLIMLEYARKAHVINPDDMDVLSLLVVGLINVSSESNNNLTPKEKVMLLQEARGYAEQSIKIDPNDAYNWANLADIEYTVANRTYKANDITPMVEAAVAAYTKANELLPSYAWDFMIGNCYHTLGLHHLFNDNHAAAQEALMQADEKYTQSVSQAKDFTSGWKKRTENLIEIIKIKELKQENPSKEMEQGLDALSTSCRLYTNQGEFPDNFNNLLQFFATRAQQNISDDCPLLLSDGQPDREQ